MRLDTIHFKYASFVSSLCERVKKNKVTVPTLRTFLLRLQAFESDKEQSLLPLEVREKLEQATTIHFIFDLIGKECASFYHYDIFQSIKEKFCAKCKHPDLNYSKHFQDYIKQLKISEFFSINPNLKKEFSDSEELAFKIGSIKMDDKVDVLENLKFGIAKILGVNPSTIKLVSVEKGCVIVNFLIPTAVAEIIFASSNKLSGNQIEQFQSLSVLWIKCGDYFMDFPTDNSEQM